MSIGERISLNGSRGTIRYIGTLNATDTVWLGVDWDDRNRGKHSGQHNGEQIFNCRPGHGSFLKQSKVNFDQSRSLGQAIRQKYIDDYANASQETLKVKGISRPLETVGFAKAQQRSQDIKSLAQISLANQLVSSLDHGSLNLSHLIDLDLSWNLLDNLHDIVQFCGKLPRLRILDLEGNRILPYVADTRTDHACESLQTLTINLCHLDWHSVFSLCNHAFPQISTLECAKNELSDVPKNRSAHQVKELNLHDNNIADLHSIIDAFHMLERLDISSNNITGIPAYSDSRPHESRLRHLNLAGNALTRLEDISNLQCYKCLDSIQYTLTFDDEKDDATRLAILQYLPQLKVINKTTVTHQERHDAAASSLGSPSKSLDALVPQHTLAQNFITLRLEYGEAVLMKKVLQTQTIKQLKGIFARFAKLKPIDIKKLKYTLGDEEIELEDDLAQLSYYSLSDDGVITLVQA